MGRAVDIAGQEVGEPLHRKVTLELRRGCMSNIIEIFKFEVILHLFSFC